MKDLFQEENISKF